MELRHLRYFKAVAETLNFTKAAAHLHLAQPALSRQIADLEYELGVDLMKRTSRSVVLTPEGKFFLEETKDILDRADNAVKTVRAQARGEAGELHIGYLPPMDLRILPRALTEFRKTAPDIKVVLHNLGTDELCGELRDGGLQLAFMLEPSAKFTDGIDFEELSRYPFFVAMAAGHPLARLKKISPKDIADQPLAVLGRKRNSEYYSILQKIFAPKRPNVLVESDSINSLITEVEIGKAVAVVSQMFKDAVGKRLMYRPLINTDVTFCVGIARAKSSDRSVAGEKLCAIIRKTISK